VDSSLEWAGSLLQIRSNVPRLLWKTGDLVTSGPGPVVIGSYLYSLFSGIPGPDSLTTSLRCLELVTGRLMWEERLGPNRQNKSFSITAANGILIVLDERGTLYTVEASPEGFKEIARCDILMGTAKPRLFRVPPVLCNARIYCRSMNGDLICIDAKK